MESLWKSDNNEVNTLVRKGIGLYNRGTYDNAITRFDEALKIEPKNELALWMKCRSKSKQGNTDEALDLLEMLIKIDSKYKRRAVSTYDKAFESIKGNARFLKLIQ